MWQNFAEYIHLQCDKNPTRICEIGVGKFTQVFDYLSKQDNIEIFKTDISQTVLKLKRLNNRPRDDKTLENEFSVTELLRI